LEKEKTETASAGYGGKGKGWWGYGGKGGFPEKKKIGIDNSEYKADINNAKSDEIVVTAIDGRVKELDYYGGAGLQKLFFPGCPAGLRGNLQISQVLDGAELSLFVPHYCLRRHIAEHDVMMRKLISLQSEAKITMVYEMMGVLIDQMADLFAANSGFVGDELGVTVKNLEAEVNLGATTVHITETIQISNKNSLEEEVKKRRKVEEGLEAKTIECIQDGKTMSDLYDMTEYYEHLYQKHSQYKELMNLVSKVKLDDNEKRMMQLQDQEDKEVFFMQQRHVATILEFKNSLKKFVEEQLEKQAGSEAANIKRNIQNHYDEMQKRKKQELEKKKMWEEQLKSIDEVPQGGWYGMYTWGGMGMKNGVKGSGNMHGGMNNGKQGFGKGMGGKPMYQRGAGSSQKRDGDVVDTGNMFGSGYGYYGEAYDFYGRNAGINYLNARTTRTQSSMSAPTYYNMAEDDVIGGYDDEGEGFVDAMETGANVRNPIKTAPPTKRDHEVIASPIIPGAPRKQEGPPHKMRRHSADDIGSMDSGLTSNNTQNSQEAQVNAGSQKMSQSAESSAMATGGTQESMQSQDSAEDPVDKQNMMLVIGSVDRSAEESTRRCLHQLTGVASYLDKTFALPKTQIPHAIIYKNLIDDVQRKLRNVTANGVVGSCTNSQKQAETEIKSFGVSEFAVNMALIIRKSKTKKMSAMMKLLMSAVENDHDQNNIKRRLLKASGDMIRAHGVMLQTYLKRWQDAIQAEDGPLEEVEDYVLAVGLVLCLQC